MPPVPKEEPVPPDPPGGTTNVGVASPQLTARASGTTANTHLHKMGKVFIRFVFSVLLMVEILFDNWAPRRLLAETRIPAAPGSR
jgi:hypothetical protein